MRAGAMAFRAIAVYGNARPGRPGRARDWRRQSAGSPGYATAVTPWAPASTLALYISLMESS